MLRASQCLRINLLQSGGPRALLALAHFLYSISRSPEKFFASWGLSSAFIADRSKFFPQQTVTWDQSIFGRIQFAVGSIT